MLDEDISRGVGGVGHAAGRAVGSAIRGALMIGALALLVGAVVYAWPIGAAAITAQSGFLVGAQEVLGAVFSSTGLFSAAAASTIGTWGLWAAAAGAATFGVTSLIPGAKQLSKVSHVVPRSVAEGMSGPSQGRARSQEMDNPYAQGGHVASYEQQQAAAAQGRGA